jgi:hypothetical protein
MDISNGSVDLLMPSTPDSTPPELGKKLGRRLGKTMLQCWDQVKVLRKCLINDEITEFMKTAGRTSRTKFRDQVLKLLIGAELIEPTIVEKPHSSNGAAPRSGIAV